MPIFIAFLEHHNESAFKPDICADRWKRENAQFVSEFNFTTSLPSQVQVVQPNTENLPMYRRNLSTSEKYRITERETKKMCEFMTEKSQNDFNYYLGKIKELKVAIEKNTLLAEPGTQANSMTIDEYEFNEEEQNESSSQQSAESIGNHKFNHLFMFIVLKKQI